MRLGSVRHPFHPLLVFCDVPDEIKIDVDYANGMYEEKEIEADGIRKCTLAVDKIPMTDAPTCARDQGAGDCLLLWAKCSPKHETRQDWDTGRVKTCKDQLAKA